MNSCSALDPSKPFNCSVISHNESRFCSGFMNVSYVYLSLNTISALCCIVVFFTYICINRLKKYSSRAFLLRTCLDCCIAVIHVIIAVISLSKGENDFIDHDRVCSVLGFFFEFAFIGGSLWYAVLAIDLLRAIRNPFGVSSQHGWKHHLVIWSVCVLMLILMGISFADNAGSGLSMFFFCWISTNVPVWKFALWSLVLYFGPHFLLGVLSFVVNICALCILLGKFPASSETRHQILKQNVVYILVLGSETALTIPFWLAQLGISSNSYSYSNNMCFLDTSSLSLAYLFAIVHSLRGVVDLVVWWVTSSIKCNDFRSIWLQYKALRYRNLYLPQENLHTPLMGNEESRVNKILRKDVMFCINFAILDAVKLNAEEETQRTHLGSVRDPFMAHVMMKYDEEEHQQEAQRKYAADPQQKEVHQRRIPFRPSNSLRDFAFIDIEPTIFGMLRNSYGVDPTTYQQSFRIKDEQDVESSGMLEKFTEGKSGSFFYFTRDYRYIIKTITSEEVSLLQKIAYRYYEHMQRNPDSVIVRLYGLHKVRLARGQKYISVVVMDNLFHNDQNLKMSERYDLKGSRVGRRVIKGNEKKEDRYKKTLKDLDLQTKIVIGPEAKTQLMEQLRKDVEFLCSLHIMDYSMLLGIYHHNQEGLRFPTAIPLEIEGGDDFTKVTFGVNVVGKTETNETIPLGLSTSASAGATATGTLERGAALAQRRGTFSSYAGDSLDESMCVSNEVKSQYIQWFHRDYGGLRSFSPHHPLNLEYTDGGSLSVLIPEEGYEGFDIRSLPNDTYYFGIVDILQQYNFDKKIENFTKTRLLCKDKEGISSVDEKRYARRFLEAMDDVFV